MTIETIFALLGAVGNVASGSTPPFETLSALKPPATVEFKQTLLTFVTDEAKCSDGDLDASKMLRPSAQLSWTQAQLEPLVYNFRVDENGRALSISLNAASTNRNGTEDIAPAIAAGAFPVGKARTGCSIRFTPVQKTVEEASLDDIYELSIFGGGIKNPAIVKRLTPAGSDCMQDRPDTLLRAYPDFAKLPATLGRPDWAMTQFDVDAKGSTKQVKTVASSGNSSLDKESVKAISKSKFVAGARQGCLYPYWRAAGKLAAPEAPEIDGIRPSDASCPAKIDWATQEMPIYPERFRRRMIEGWAIVTFDVAPWGGTGNVKVAAAEPASEFARSAEQAIMRRKVSNAGKALTGCVERVFFRMQDKKPAADESKDEPIF